MLLDLWFCVYVLYRCLSFCTFSFDDLVLRSTASDYLLSLNISWSRDILLYWRYNTKKLLDNQINWNVTYPGFRVSLIPTALSISIHVPIPCRDSTWFEGCSLAEKVFVILWSVLVGCIVQPFVESGLFVESTKHLCSSSMIIPLSHQYPVTLKYDSCSNQL
jgi:peptidoglycan biosynthesis protein MviN/MurJ (putative lipid II flippase)